MDRHRGRRLARARGTGGGKTRPRKNSRCKPSTPTKSKSLVSGIGVFSLYGHQSGANTQMPPAFAASHSRTRTRVPHRGPVRVSVFPRVPALLPRVSRVSHPSRVPRRARSRETKTPKRTSLRFSSFRRAFPIDRRTEPPPNIVPPWAKARSSRTTQGGLVVGARPGWRARPRVTALQAAARPR